MKLGVCHLWGDSPETYRQELRLSNELGFDIVGIGDSPAGWGELYVSLTLAVIETDTAIVTPFVTSPFLRHPLVVASAFSSLQDLSGGRMAMGLATGGSNVFAVGRGQAKQQEVRAYWDALEALQGGESVSWEDRPVSPLHRPRKVPVYYSAFGPKALKLAGEKADGVILFTGMNLDETAAKIRVVRDSAREHGRDPEDVDIWVTSYCSIRDTREQAVDDLKAFIVVNGLAIGLIPGAMAQVPPHLTDKLVELQSRYDTSEHVAVGGKNVRLLDELGPELTEFLAGRDTVVGPPAEVKTVIDGLESLGVSAFITNMPGHADREGNMRALTKLIKG